MRMEETIVKICKEIEHECDVEILFCVESGSRAWGIESKDSDYDVRFVYVKTVDQYMQINPSKEVITRSYDKDGKPMSQEGCFLDFQGFDILKFTRMLSASNPTVIEWLMSDIHYYGEKNQVFVDYAKNDFKPISLYYHYKSMCKQNYLKYLKSGNLVTYKKYLYAMRGLVNAKWIAKYRQLPDIKFTRQVFFSKNLIDGNVRNKLQDIIILKKNQKEKESVQNVVRLDNYIESFLKDDSDAPKGKKLSTVHKLQEELNKIMSKKCSEYLNKLTHK